PYNTGSDGFVYQDDRKFTPQQLAQLGGMDLDEAKRVLEFTAKKSNSHSAWLTFMYPRLYVARELLRDDGVIFISIDDNEQAQLKILCDEVFGEENFVTTLHIELSATQGMKVKAAKEGNIVKNAEYILVYSMDKKNNISHNLLYDSRVDYDSHYNKIIENGMLVNLKEYFIDNIEPVFRNENIQDLYVKSREFRKCIENNLS
ncbi:site-specific DNA-methyltransferase, partial [Kingella kingae]